MSLSDNTEEFKSRINMEAIKREMDHNQFQIEKALFAEPNLLANNEAKIRKEVESIRFQQKKDKSRDFRNTCIVTAIIAFSSAVLGAFIGYWLNNGGGCP